MSDRHPTTASAAERQLEQLLDPRAWTAADELPAELPTDSSACPPDSAACHGDSAASRADIPALPG